MEFRDYVDTLRRRWLSVSLFVLAGVAIATILALTTTPIFQATTRIFVSTQSVGSAIEAFQGSSYTQQRMQSYVEVTTNPVVLDEVIAELDLDATADELAMNVSANVVPDTVLIEIVGSSPSAAAAAQIANAVARSLRDVVVNDLEQQVGDERALVNLTVVKRATEPSTPSSPVIPLYILIGAVFGLIVGLAFAFMRQVLDTRLRSERDVSAVTNIPIIGGFLYDQTATKHPLIVHVSPRGGRAEAFRSLRTNLQFVDFEVRNRAFVITSTLQAEGKSTVAANLAIALSDSGTKTLLIDADLRRPRIAEYMAIEGAVGLSDVLIGKASLEDALQPWGETNKLWVLPAGSRPPNPSELLGSRSMAALLAELRGEFEQIVIDVPPLLPVTDGAILSRMTDGALIVCAVGLTRGTQLKQALSQLDNINANILGIVVNMLPSKGPDSYGVYGYEYAGPEVIRPRG